MCLGGALPLPAHDGAVRAPRKHTVHAQLGGGFDGEQVAAVLRERLHQVDVRAGVFLAELLHAHDDAAVGQGVHGAHGSAAGAVTQVDALPYFHALDEGVLALGAVQLEGCAGGEGLVLFGADVEDGGAHGAPWVLMGGASCGRCGSTRLRGAVAVSGPAPCKRGGCGAHRKGPAGTASATEIYLNWSFRRENRPPRCLTCEPSFSGSLRRAANWRSSSRCSSVRSVGVVT